MTTKFERANQSLETLHHHATFWSGGPIPQLIYAVTGLSGMSVYAGVLGLLFQSAILVIYLLNMLLAPQSQFRFGNLTFLMYALTTLGLFAATLFVSPGGALALIATAFAISTLRAAVLAAWAGFITMLTNNPALKLVYGERFKQYALNMLSNGLAVTAAVVSFMLPAGVALTSSVPITLLILAAVLMNLVEVYNYFTYNREVPTQHLAEFEQALADKNYFSQEVVYAPSGVYSAAYQAEAVPKNVLTPFRELIARHFQLPQNVPIVAPQGHELRTTEGRMRRLVNRIDASLAIPDAHAPVYGFQEIPLLAEVPGNLQPVAHTALKKEIADNYALYRAYGKCGLFDLHARTPEEAVLDSAAHLVRVDLSMAPTEVNKASL